MVEMAMSYQNRVDFGRQMSHSLCNARHVRLKTRTKRDTQKINTRKIGIDQERVPVELKLITICPEVHHPHSVAWHCASVPYDQVRVRIQPRA